MQASPLLHCRADLFGASPNVGGLMALCEENYSALMRLAPSLATLSGCVSSKPACRAELKLTVIEQARYTTSLRLTHAFEGSSDESQPPAEPDAVLRAYHDAEQVEVLSLRQTVLPILSHYDAPALAAKWRANLFLSKWLGYCLGEGYRFTGEAGMTVSSTRPELMPSV
jgi:uncharacterized protein YqiB (DUF1249 family)